MEITKVVVNKVDKENLKGYASVTLDNELVINSMRIIRGKKRLFLAMPSKIKSNGKYDDIVHPITQNFREKIESAVLNEYYK